MMAAPKDEPVYWFREYGYEYGGESEERVAEIGFEREEGDLGRGAKGKEGGEGKKKVGGEKKRVKRDDGADGKMKGKGKGKGKESVNADGEA